MTWFNRRPARRPHPDPARELELQRILDLRASIARRADLIKQYRDAIYGLHLDARQSRRQDAEVLLREVEACGFVPYEPGKPPKTPAEQARTITSYRRP